MKKRLIALALMASLTLATLAGCGSSSDKPDAKPDEGAGSDFPNDTITIIVPWGVGGGVDVIARKVAQIGEKYIGQPIIVENHTGASGTIAMADFLDAKSDGYTMVVANGPLFSLTPYFLDVDYSFDDFAPLRGMRTMDAHFLVNPQKSGIETFEDLLEYGKANGGIKFATSGGPGNDQYTMANAIFEQLGVPAEAVVYDGQAENINAIVGGHVDMAIASPPSYYEHAEAGTIKAVATLLPDAVETPYGEVPPVSSVEGCDVDFTGMDYFAVKSDVPEDIQAVLADMLDKVYADQEFIDYMAEMGFDIWDVDGDEIVQAVNDQCAVMEKYAK